MRYTKPGEGEWLKPVHNGYKLGCCDCGLVHKMDFRVVKGKVEFRAFRDERATAQKRRWRKAKAEAK
jgi:hypothetical protein